MTAGHTSVLLDEVMEGLAIVPDDVVVDATIGGTGHFKEMLMQLGSEGVLIGFDADHAAIERATAVVAADTRESRPATHIVEDNFRHLDRVLTTLNVDSISKALFDLGWSGFQLSLGRGFSFQGDEPLLMTYGNPESSTTAAELVNSLSEKDLADMIYKYGEERFSRQIAKSIVKARGVKPILTTSDLVSAVQHGVPNSYRNGRIHCATKTFQALRIAVNDEFGAITEGLEAAIKHLSSGGRIAVITFHSIEDRIVKNLFRDAAEQGKGIVVNKKVIAPSKEEVARNPRSRSAKLRLFEAAITHDSATIAYA